jgi:hypothetical protein
MFVYVLELCKSEAKRPARGFFPRGQSGRGVKLTADLHLVTRSVMVELYGHSPMHFHGVVLNSLSPGITLMLKPAIKGR